MQFTLSVQLIEELYVINKLRLSWAKLKPGLVRVAIEDEIEDAVDIKVVGGWVAR